MVNTTVKDLPGRQSRATSAPGGCIAIPFSLPFIGIGAWVSLFAPTTPALQNSELPVPVIQAFGGMFFLAGSVLFVSGIVSLLRRARHKRLAALHPNEPWLADHPWNPQGARTDNAGAVWKAIFGAFFFALFMAPFNWVAFFLPSIPMVARVFVIGVVGLFDLVIIAVLWQGIYLFLRQFKYGTSHLRFERFPFFLGETLNARFGSTRPIGAFNSMKITLRFVREQSEGSGEDQHMNVRQHYAETLEIKEAGVHEGGGADIPITFNLPAGEYETKLSAAEPRYWEVEIEADTPGVDFSALFLVPVYIKTSRLTEQLRPRWTN